MYQPQVPTILKKLMRKLKSKKSNLNQKNDMKDKNISSMRIHKIYRISMQEWAATIRMIKFRICVRTKLTINFGFKNIKNKMKSS